jgi:hypothetical protein
MGEWFLSQRERFFVPEGRLFVPEGRCDRSLARGAWESANPGSRPVGYGVIRAGERMSEPIR